MLIRSLTRFDPTPYPVRRQGCRAMYQRFPINLPYHRTMTVSPLLAALRARPGWDVAMTELRGFWKARQPGVETDDTVAYSAVYSARRAAMVFDVVASRQRDYLRKVRALVADFERRPAAADLAALASNGPGLGLSLMPQEAITVKLVAAGLHQYCEERELDDDHGVAHWAASTEPLRFAPRLDSYVGSVSGIGVALFAYLRMRSGADAIKPDLRVRRSLNRMGFNVPPGENALLLLAEGAAEELGVARLALDQVLW